MTGASDKELGTWDMELRDVEPGEMELGTWTYNMDWKAGSLPWTPQRKD